MSANFTPSFEAYSGQKPFKWWAQNVLPLVYDDSLSYMELLAKVTNYLNNTINDVSTMENNIDTLVDTYKELEDYVNNYFTDITLNNLGFVTPQMFGAVGDGVVDDSAAINTALTYGNVVIPEGTYLITTSLAIRRSNINVKCYGKIELSSNFPTNLPGLVIGNQTENISNIVVDGMFIDCSKRPTVAYPNRTGNGIYIRSYTNTNERTATYCSHVGLFNCKVIDNPRGYGIASGGSYDSNGVIERQRDIFIQNCISTNNYLAFATSCSQSTLINNYGADSDVENFTCDNYSTNCLFIGNKSVRSGNGACSMGGDNCSNSSWIGNVIDSAGETAVVGISNVGFTFNAQDTHVENCLVIGNKITGFDRGLWLKNRLSQNMDYSAKNCLFIANNFYGNTYDLFLDECYEYNVLKDNIYADDIYYANAESLLKWVVDFGYNIDVSNYLTEGVHIVGDDAFTPTPANIIETSSDAVAGELETFSVVFHAYQEGLSESNQPSPTNILPITGYNTLTAYVNSIYDVEGAESYLYGWGSVGTCYGGEIYPDSGLFTKTHDRVDLGTLTWVKTTAVNQQGYPIFRSQGFTTVKPSSIPQCECYKYSGTFNVTQYPNFSIGVHDTATTIYICDSRFSEAADLKTWLSGKYLVYELNTHEDYEISTYDLPSIDYGRNYIWCNIANSTIWCSYLISKSNYIAIDGKTVSIALLVNSNRGGAVMSVPAGLIPLKDMSLVGLNSDGTGFQAFLEEVNGGQEAYLRGSGDLYTEGTGSELYSVTYIRKI